LAFHPFIELAPRFPHVEGSLPERTVAREILQTPFNFHPWFHYPAIMRFSIPLITPTHYLLTALLAAVLTSAQLNAIFHGTSIVIQADRNNPYPGNSTFIASNFFAYSTPAGYLSFGW
jgi:hypothetical protein